MKSNLLKAPLFAAATLLAMTALALAQPADEWSGNLVKNPGFEEDFVNLHAEPHVISFKGDWFYNQKDYVPDNWSFPDKGTWQWNTRAPHSGEHSLRLGENQSATQNYNGATYNAGGGAWERGAQSSHSSGAPRTPTPTLAGLRVVSRRRHPEAGRSRRHRAQHSRLAASHCRSSRR